MTTPERHPLDALLDLLLYAPIGFATSSRELMPGLAAKGREQLDSQVRVARAIGQLAVTFGSRKACTRLRAVLGGQTLAAQPEPPEPSAATDASPVGGLVTPAMPARPAGVAKVTARASTRRAAPRPPEEEVVAVRRHRPDDAGTAAPDASDLAIPGYDSLAASQVVARLEGLTTAELEAVRRYEQAHRNRRTVLGKVSQLEGTRG